MVVAVDLGQPPCLSEPAAAEAVRAGLLALAEKTAEAERRPQTLHQPHQRKEPFWRVEPEATKQTRALAALCFGAVTVATLASLELKARTWMLQAAQAAPQA